MKRPEHWNDLPYSVIESIVKSCSFEYDAYTESQAGAEHAILCGAVQDGEPNYKIVSEAYKQMSDTDLSTLLTEIRRRLEYQLKEIDSLIRS